MKNYEAPDERLWTGRSTPIDYQYWHQVIELVDLERKDLPELELGESNIAILGYAADEGVSRNQGRPGAINGPMNIRQQLSKLSVHSASKVFDFGDVTCSENSMEGGQAVLANMVSQLVDAGMLPIVLGGGHDIAFGHYVGLSNAGKCKDKTVGIINFDAHFDLRAVETEGNSGTPFYQIHDRLSKAKKEFKYMAIGIQEQANTKELFDRADAFSANYIPSDACKEWQMDDVLSKITDFLAKVDYVYITIDLDGFSSAYAPGVSAPSALGFSPSFVVETLKEIFKSGKVISCDIAELNPIYDQDNCTAKLAARLVDAIVKMND